MDLNLVIGGEAGQGLKTIEHILSKSLFRLGFHIYSSKDYMSRVRGGHNFMSIRISDQEVFGPAEREDILIALNEETIERHKDKVDANGFILYDGEVDIKEKEMLSIPAKKIARKVGNSKTANTVFVGAVFKLLGLQLEIVKEVIEEQFADKEEVQEVNLQALEKGYQAVDSKFELIAPSNQKERVLINGNQAVGLGAVTAGVQFYSAYPMTPSTGVMNYIASKENQLGIAVEQAEDELAAIMMALGASYSGVRTMTGTSGGGFSLMNESLGFAGIAELPLVIAEVQRPGPATGLPTRTEQGDLSFVVNASQGDFPLMVIAPRDVEDAFYQTFRAFNLAEKYQLPVVVLTDQFLADSSKDITEFDFESLKIESGFISDKEAQNITDYKRYEFTANGISPMAYPGQIPDEVVVVDSDEHDEKGHIIEKAQTRTQMVDKRAKKLDNLAAEDLKEPEYIGEDEVDYLLICWGSTFGPLMEAKELLDKDGYQVGILSFSDVWPLPAARLEDLVTGSQELVVVEGNSTGQFARLIQGETNISIDHKLLKYDGRPFTGQEIYRRIRKEVAKNA
ncbi:2-oxoacid:acceptor oxidoreductase subunit alpha [Halanaerocella petrolearia]